MNRLLAMLACVSLCLGLGLGTTGCGKKATETAGKGGTTKPTEKTGGTDTTLDLKANPNTVKVKQGAEAKTELTLTRGKDVKKDVDLSVDITPKGKGLEVDYPKSLLTDKKTAELVIKAGPTATAGEYSIKVTASSSGVSPSGFATITVTVEAAAAPPKKDVKLEITGPEKDVTVKQDGKADTTVTLKLGKDLETAELKAEVKSKDDKAVKEADIKVTVPAKDNKAGDAKVTITVGPEAAPGDYVATITATSEGATAATAKINIKVEKK